VIESNNNQVKLEPITKGLPITFYLIKTNKIDPEKLDQYDIVTIDPISESREMDGFNRIKMFDPVQFFIGINSNSSLLKTKTDRCKFLSDLDPKNVMASYNADGIEANDLIPAGTLGYSQDENFNNELKKLSIHSANQKFFANDKTFCLAYLIVSVQGKYIKENLNMIKNIYPTIQTMPIENVKKYGKEFASGKCDAILFAWKSNYLDGYEFLTMFENSDANFTGINDKSLANKIIKSQDIANPKVRYSAYRKIISQISNMCIVRPLFTLPSKNIYVRKGLKTPQIGLNSIEHYYLGNVSR